MSGEIPMRPELITHTCSYIASIQLESGGIPWFDGGIIDPWDHVESAMGLTVGGRIEEAEAAYGWLREHQHQEGYWLAAYNGDQIADGTRAETNFVAYVATGVWHHYLATGDRSFLTSMWPTVMKALNFVLSLQAPTGEIYWTLLAEPMAMADIVELLLTAFPGVDADQIRADVAVLLDTLTSKNLLLVGSDQTRA